MHISTTLPLLLSLLFFLLTEGKSLLGPDGSDLGNAAWLSYPTSMTRYPQCCADRDNCQMLRLSESVVSSLALAAPYVRGTYTGKFGNMVAVMAFDSTTGDITGKAVIDGSLYYIEPLTEEERSSPLCFKEEQKAYMQLFHKIIKLKDTGELPPPLTLPLEGTPTSECCQSSLPGVCSKVSVDASLLSSRTAKVSLPLPWRTPKIYRDSLEIFSLAATQPEECQGYCDMYHYSGAAGLKVKVVMSNTKPAFSILRGGLHYSVEYCQAEQGYVVTAEKVIAPESKNVNRADNRLPEQGRYWWYWSHPARTAEFGCTYHSMYCNFDRDELVVAQEDLEDGVDFTQKCRELCGANSDCSHFTWHYSRGTTTCYLMDTCDEDYDASCLRADPVRCASGPKVCDNSTEVVTGCDPPAYLGPDYIPWQCHNVQGYVLTSAEMKETLPVGTNCYLRCDAWKTLNGERGYLETTCDSEGFWTPTKPHTGDGDLVFPLGPYPDPTHNTSSPIQPLKCDCVPLSLKWPPGVPPQSDIAAFPYNPDNEDGTEFACDDSVDISNNTFIIGTDNKCLLYCDTHLAATVRCKDGLWTGEPEKGFWCYEEPTGSTLLLNEDVVGLPDKAGEDCNRDCIADSNNYTCNFYLEVRKQHTDSPGRFADGRNRTVLTYNGTIPGPSIVVCFGDTVNIKMTNLIGDEPYVTNDTTLHLHGVAENGRPWSDGVPKFTQCPIESDDSFNYGFNIDSDAPSGTYWYHSHVCAQRQNGLYGPLIIMPRKKASDVDLDDPVNTLVIQEWYSKMTNMIPVSILINGNTKILNKYNSLKDDMVNYEKFLEGYLKGRDKHQLLQAPSTAEERANGKYSVFDISPGIKTRFRIVGAISQNFPLQVVIEDHIFTAIAKDSLDFEPIANLDALWVSAGERVDIVVEGKSNPKEGPYKIFVSGNWGGSGPLCSIAWLKYPGQTIDTDYTFENCPDYLNSSKPDKTFNPVTDQYIWTETESNVFLTDIRHSSQPKTINGTSDGTSTLVGTHYIFMSELRFNDFTMTFPKVPFLFQNPTNTTNRCGTSCDIHGNCTSYLPSQCSDVFPCDCEHVIKNPYVPELDDEVMYWFEWILINDKSGGSVAHPIHQHGGWFSVVGMGQLEFSRPITKEMVITMDTKYCSEGTQCLERNFDRPASIDTIQVPVNGYAILRTRLDNAGTWIVHCHINAHVLAGMAMMFQFGGLDDDPVTTPIGGHKIDQQWDLGPYTDQINGHCPKPQDHHIIPWYFGMAPVDTCGRPGDLFLFNWAEKEHNVNKVDEENYNFCNGSWSDTKPRYGDFVWQAPDTLYTSYYFACGMGNGYHCSAGNMKAKIMVTENCNDLSNTCF